MRYVKLSLVLAAAALLLLSGCERKVTEQVNRIISPSEAQYIGSSACEACHKDLYDSFMRTGHPFKLNEAEDAQQPDYYPFTVIPSPPPGVSWDEVDKVIGGFWWKARFIRHSGAIITGDQVQYNFATGEWVAYHAGEDKPYKCGPCHMTAYKADGHQEGKDSLIGTWVFNGIQCEECHGPGELHIADPYNIDMIIDRSSEACGKCHFRDSINVIPASGNFIRHHEQWNEMFASKHAALKCVDCHNPHRTLHPSAGSVERAKAIKTTCEECHFQSYLSLENTGIGPHKNNSSAPQECVDCHMPKASKSAVAEGTYVGDVSTHLWGINTDSTAEMFYTGSDGKKYAKGYLTLEYTCLKCHINKDKQWASENAHNAHGPEPVGPFSSRDGTVR